MVSRSGRRASSLPAAAAARCARYFPRPLLRLLARAAMLAVAASLPALPAYAYVGDLHTIQTTAGDGVMYPDVAYNPTLGDYLVVWEDDYNNTGDTDIWGRVMHADGTPVTGAFWIASSFFPEICPRAASLGGDSWLVVFVKVIAGSEYEVHGRVVTEAGWTTDHIYHTSTTAIEQVDVGASPAGDTYAIVFDVQRAAHDWDILYALAAADGSRTMGPYDVVGTSDDDDSPSINQNGQDFLVAWTRHGAAGHESIVGCPISRVGALGSEIAIYDDGGTSCDPSVASDGADPEHFLVAFADRYQDTTDYDIWYAFVSAGAVESADYLPGAYTSRLEQSPGASFTGLPDAFFIAWVSSLDADSESDVLGTFLLRDGTSAPINDLATSEAVSERHPQATPLSGGQLAVVWDQWLGAAWDVNINERDCWYPLPNLCDDGPLWQSFAPTTVAAGDAFSASCQVANRGDAASGPFVVRVYASADTTIEGSDWLIGEVAMPGLPADAYAPCDWLGPFPDTVPPGTYWVGWVIDPEGSVIESNESDNATYLSDYQLTVALLAPVAAFSAAPTLGAAPLSVAFTDTSTGVIDSWFWDFGDSTNSTDQNPSHTYTAVGSFDVSLTVANSYGSDTETKPGYIQVVEPVGADFSAAGTVGIVPLEVSFTDLSTGAPTAWVWNFGDGTSSADKNPTHTYTDPGYYAVTLTASKTGATGTETKVGFIAAGFTDTPPESNAFYEILGCVQAGVVQGYWNDTYRPALSVSRGQVGMYIARVLAGGETLVPEPPEGQQTFLDVDPLHAAYKHVEYCVAKHVVQGFGDGTYRPEKNVNRGQMAMCIARSLVQPGGDAAVPVATGGPTFPDVTADGEWAQCFDHVEYLAGLGVVQGFWDGLYHPEREVRRDQMALYVQRAFDLPIYPQ